MDAPSRTGRKDPGNKRATVRDLVGLSAIALLQPMFSTQYRRYLSLHPEIARRSLNRLRDLGLLRVHVVAMERASLFTMTPAGQREVARFTGREVDEVLVLRDLPAAGLDHHLATVDAVVALTVAAARSKRLALAECMLDRDLRRQLGNPRGVLVPDAVMVLSVRENAGVGADANDRPVSSVNTLPISMCSIKDKDVGKGNDGDKGKVYKHATGASGPGPGNAGGGENLVDIDKPVAADTAEVVSTNFAVAIEADLGTENPSWVVSHKAVPYGAARAAGHPLRGCADWCVLFITPTTRRMHRLAAAACEAGVPEGVLYFAVAGEVTDRTFLTAAWKTYRPAGTGGEYHLVNENPFPGARSACTGRSCTPGGAILSSPSASSSGANVAVSGRGCRA